MGGGSRARAPPVGVALVAPRHASGPARREGNTQGTNLPLFARLASRSKNVSPHPAGQSSDDSQTQPRTSTTETQTGASGDFFFFLATSLFSFLVSSSLRTPPPPRLPPPPAVRPHPSRPYFPPHPSHFTTAPLLLCLLRTKNVADVRIDSLLHHIRHRHYTRTYFFCR